MAEGPEAAEPPEPFARRLPAEEEAFPFAEGPPSPRAARSLGLPHPAFARLLGRVDPGDVVLLEGAPDVLGALAHALLVEAVRDGDDVVSAEPRAVVVDGGNCVSPYLFASAARERGLDPELLVGRVRLARAFTAYQLVSLMTESLEAELAREPCELLVVLCARELFEDQDLAPAEARSLARYAAGGVRAASARHALPCVVTSPSPSAEARSRALERIIAAACTRVVADLRFESLPGARGGIPRPVAASLAPGRRIDAAQAALDAWGEMPPRPRLVGEAPAGTPRGGALIAAHWRPKRPSPA